MRGNLDLRKHAEDLVDKARMAPSLYNAQPWAFRVRSNAVEVYADRSRAVSHIDPDGRQLLIGVGAAVFAVRLGVSLLGAEPTIALLPGAEHGDLAALISVGPDHLPTVAEVRLMEQVPLRRTVHGHLDEVVPERTKAALVREADVESAQLAWVEDASARQALAHLLTLAERRESADPRIQAELARWMGGPAPSALVGETAALGDTAVLGDAAVLGGTADATLGHTAEVGGTAELGDTADAAMLGDAVAIVSTDGDRPADWLRAGQALMRVLLAASADGLVAAYLNQPLELPDVRPRVRDELGLHGFPQVILRFGRPAAGWPVPTPRRPVADLLRP